MAVNIVDINNIVREAMQQAPRAMPQGVTARQAAALDAAGYHSFATFNPATNQDIPADKVQRWFEEAKAWKYESALLFDNCGKHPVPGGRR
jgi:hypothetical protein